MTALNQTALVPFRNQTLLTVRDGDHVRVAIRPICDALGLDWSAQYRRLLRNPVLADSVAIMATESTRGDRNSITLPLDMLNGWLFGFDVNKVRPAARDGLIAYQRECYAVLAKHWGITPRPAMSEKVRLSAHRLRAWLLAQVAKSSNAAERRGLHDQLALLSFDIGVPCPDLGEFIPVDLHAAARDEFFAAVNVLLAGDSSINHSRDPGLLALSLPEVLAAAQAAGQPLPLMAELRKALHSSTCPRFVAVKAVNSAQKRRGTVKCWVFENNRRLYFQPGAK